jgi:hypothetical protein
MSMIFYGDINVLHASFFRTEIFPFYEEIWAYFNDK